MGRGTSDTAVQAPDRAGVRPVSAPEHGCAPWAWDP